MKHIPLVGVDIQCKTCGKIFKVPNNQALTAKYCSRACMHEGHRKRVTKPCHGCGKPVTKRPSEGSKSKRWFCSLECLNKWQRSEESPLHASWDNPQMLEASSERLKEWRNQHEHPLLGKHHSEETRKKIALARTEPPNMDSVIYHRESVRKSVLARIALAKEKLGGVCQLCGSSEKLHFAHVYYPKKRKYRQDTYSSALDALKFEGSVLLLCKECHNHPEKYLKELIDLRVHTTA